MTNPSSTTTSTTWTDPLVRINNSASSFVHYRITAVDDFEQESGYSNSVSTRSFQVPKTSADLTPQEIALYANYPNPFNPETQIHFDLPDPAHVSLKIYNVLGKEVRTLVDNELDANFHTVKWDGKNHSNKEVPSGVYIYRIEIVSQKAVGSVFTQTRKMTLLR